MDLQLSLTRVIIPGYTRSFPHLTISTAVMSEVVTSCDTMHGRLVAGTSYFAYSKKILLRVWRELLTYPWSLTTFLFCVLLP